MKAGILLRDEAFYLESELIKKGDSFFTQSGDPVEWIKEESYFFKLSFGKINF